MVDLHHLVTDLLIPGIGPVDKIIRTVVVYLFIALLLRVAGKRLMAQMNSLDLVVVLLLSNVVQNAIIGPDNSLLGGLIGALVLVGVNAGLERATARSRLLTRIFEGGPTTLAHGGRADRQAMERLGLTDGELRAALRRQGADDIAEVEHADIEPGGDIVVNLRREEQNVSYGELRAAVDELKAYIHQMHRETPGRGETHP